jgi:hypothetical protein
MTNHLGSTLIRGQGFPGTAPSWFLPLGAPKPDLAAMNPEDDGQGDDRCQDCQRHQQLRNPSDMVFTSTHPDSARFVPVEAKPG